MDHAERVVSQLVQQGARCDGGEVVRVASDRVFYLHFEPGQVPPWVAGADLVSAKGESGVYELNLVSQVGRVRLGPVEIEVECTKLSSSEFWALVSEVSDYVTQLPFSHRGTGLGFAGEFDAARPVDYHVFVYVSNLVREGALQAAVAHIAADPHVTFLRERQLVRVERARRADAAAVRDICANPARFEPIRPGCSLAVTALSARVEGGPLAGRFPGTVLSSTISPTLDNPENQYVKHVLEFILHVAASVKRAHNCPSDVAAEADWIVGVVERLLAFDLFRGVSRLRAVNIASQVLQRKPGYRDMLSFHAQMLLPPTPAWELDLKRILELKDAALLYEYWVFVQVCKAVEGATGRPPTRAGRGVERDGLHVWLVHGMRVEFGDGVAVSFNKETKSYSRRMRPDVMLATPAGTWVFDAKFSLDRQPDGDDTAKFDDICKMHTYRDSLFECRGAYAVYPGDEWVMYDCDRGRLGAGAGASAAVAVDGVGAIPARPGEGGLSAAVRETVREVLELGRCAVSGPPEGTVDARYSAAVFD